MPHKKRTVHPDKHGKNHGGSRKRSSSSKSRTKKDSAEPKEKAKEKEEKEEDGGDENASDDEENQEDDEEDENLKEAKEGVQMKYVPYSPQYVGPQQRSNLEATSPMGPGMGMTMAVPMQALIPVYSPMEGVLPGLEALSVSGGCFVKQELDLAEMFSGFEMNNRYSVFNSLGQRIYLAAENTTFCTRFCFGHNRPFQVNVFSGVGEVILIIERKQNYALCWWGGSVAGSHITVTHVSTGEEIGTVRQNCNICNPSYEVLDANGTLLLNIRGPSCGSLCPYAKKNVECFWLVMCCDVKFDVTDPENNEVGQIMKTFQMLEMISDVTFFGVKYSEELPVNLKALILASVICVDFSYFEGSQGMRGSGHRGHRRRGGGEKNSINLSGCRCLWGWLWIALIIGLVVYARIHWTNCKRRKYDPDKCE